jgi:hypothetical protein
MAAPAVGIGTLRRLGELGTGGDPVLSVYLDLDSTRYPGTATHDREIEALIAGVEPRAAQADVSRVRQLLRCLPGLAYGTRGIAMFSSAGGSAHEAVQLPSPASPMAVVDTIPWLEPLAAMFTAGDWGAAVLGRHAGRLFRGGPGRWLSSPPSSANGTLDLPTATCGGPAGEIASRSLSTRGSLPSACCGPTSAKRSSAS